MNSSGTKQDSIYHKRTKMKLEEMNITCPSCDHEFRPMESYSKIVQEELDKEKKSLHQSYKEKEVEVQKIKKKLEISHSEFNKKVQNEINSKIPELTKKIQANAQQNFGMELNDLKKRLQEKENSLSSSKKTELELRQQVRKVIEREKELDLEVEKNVTKQIHEIEKRAQIRADENFKLKILEKDKKIQEIEQSLEEAKRTASKGSQQTQGEVVEEEFEKLLKAKFPLDDFDPVPKGIQGADLIQKVKNSGGGTCGNIVWEFKQTKTFSHKWVPKLKEDLQSIGATVGILVTHAMPKESEVMELIDGIYVVSYSFALYLAIPLRKKLIEVSYTQLVGQGKEQKMSLIYDYLTGPSFKQKLTTIIDAFKTLKDDLEKEKRAFKRMWAQREKSLELAIDSTTTLVGDITGIAGSSAPIIDDLSLPYDKEEASCSSQEFLS